MTNPPHGGSASPPGTIPSGAVPAGAVPAGTNNSDFGATTLSGRTVTDRPGGDRPDAHFAPAAPAPERGSHAAGDRPVPPQGGPGAAQAAPPTGTTSIRGIRTGRNRGPRRARLQIRH